MIERYETYEKLVRITAFVYLAAPRFKEKDRIGPSAEKTTKGLLSKAMLQAGQNYWIRYTQIKHLGKELRQLESEQDVEVTSNLSILCPFLDTEGIIRARGRISKAQLSYNEKFPIIIPAHSIFCQKIIRAAHANTLHGGVQQIMHYLRTKYWIIGLRRAAKGLIKSCVTCRRFRKRPIEQLMGDLPKERVTISRPFAYCGVDYFGPIKVKRYAGRCKTIDTGYGAVFICLTTRMIHIESVSDLTSEKFLWALQRVASIYSMPEKMFSDNAKTFKGAANELKRMREVWMDACVEDFLNSKGVKWQFIAPRAPFQGGIWEAAVNLQNRIWIESCEDRYYRLSSIRLFLQKSPQFLIAVL